MNQKTLTIVIVGGVAGGASAATRARRMNEHAEIILFEKDEYVSFANCGLPYYIGDEIPNRSDLVVASADFLRQRFKLDVRTRQEVTSVDRQEKLVQVRNSLTGEVSTQRYDKLILAPGASPIVPPIDGVDAPNVQVLRNLEDTDHIRMMVDADRTRRAVVVGSGYIGLEMAEQLSQRGLEVSLVELHPQVLPLLDSEMAKPIELELEERGVALFLGNGLESIETNGLGFATGVKLSDGTTIETDLVVLGIGIRPNTQLASEAGLEIGSTGGIATNPFMQTNDPDIYAVGDVAEYPYGPTQSQQRIALAGPANRSGRLAGEHAATGKCAKMPSVQGTSIARIFGVNAAVTGLTENLASRMGVEIKSVTIVAKNHAGYFPGAQTMTLKLSYAPGEATGSKTGKILGAQIIGGDGVDKRIDVIATAMHFGGTVWDLAGVDLAYAPPFGSAKDPVHMAAFVACNQLDGIEEFCGAAEDLADVQVVDVRTVGEVERTPLQGAGHAINIPVDELRDSLDQLDRSRPTVVSCAVGVRGHIACRILKQSGFESVRNLTGGATVRNRAMG